MTKNHIVPVWLVASVLLMSSCLFSTNSKNKSHTFEGVLGSWSITKTSLKTLKDKGTITENSIITSFTLHADSTVVVSFGGAEKKRLDGNWTWKAEKKLGNKNFGLTFYSDVVIRVSGHTLGLQLNEKRGKKQLTARDYTFEKQK